MVKIIKFIGLGATLLLLCACASKTATQSANFSKKPVADSEATAQSYALQQNPGFSGEVQHNENGEIINLLSAPANQTYYFAFDSNAVKSDDYQAIMIQAKYLVAHPGIKIRLEGNTDDRGSREYNIALGWRRDQAVAKVLEQYGVGKDQIDMLSYGKEKPAVMGDGESAWQLNRRVNLVYEQN